MKHIIKDSIQAAENVAVDVIKKISALASHPQKYPPDKYKSENDGSYRVFEIHHLRIAYHTSDNGIRIIRIRHTSMEPLQY